MNDRDIEQLLRHGEFLRALARTLLNDPARADDVVQETWLAALAAKSRPRKLHRGWLAGILQNLARRAIRGESRRTRRECAAARDVLTTPTDDLYGRHALHERIRELMNGLPELYRVPLLLRYDDNLDVATIAARLGIAPSTVRTRLQRGLDRLRGRLNEGARPKRAWIPFLLALPRRPRAGTPRAPWTAARAVAACALAVVTIALLLRGEGYSGPAPDRGRRVARAGVVLPSEASTGVGADRTGRADFGRASTDPASETGNAHVLTGIVELDYPASDDRIALDIEARRGSETIASGLHATVRSGEPFAISLDRLCRGGMPDAFDVRASHPDAVPGRVETAVLWYPGTERAHIPAVSLRLVRALRLRGRVVQACGAPAADVTVLAFPFSGKTPIWPARAEARSDANGRFDLRVEKAGPYAVIAVSECHRPAARRLLAGDDAPLDSDPFVLESGLDVRGTVRRPDGRGVARACIRVRTTNNDGALLVLPGRRQALVWSDDRADWLAREVRTGPLGHFRATGLAARPYEVGLSAVIGCDADLLCEDRVSFRTVVPPDNVEFEVASGRLLVRVAPPGRGTRVVAHPLGQPEREIHAIVANGYFALDLVPGARYTVEVSRTGWETSPRTATAPAAGRLRDLHVEMLPSTSNAVLEVAIAAPPSLAVPACWRFLLERPGGGSPIERTARIEGGVFRVSHLPPGTYGLVARAADTACGHVLPARVPVRLVARETTRVALPVEAAGRLLVDVATPDSETCSRVECWVESAAGQRTSLSHPGARRYLSPPLRPGIYTLHVRPAVRGARTMSRRVLVRERHTSPLVIHLADRSDAGE
jgi:RNA polymerase sigma-70 factor (ECF subfamily)